MLKKIAPSLIITLSGMLIIVMDSKSHSPVNELETRGPVNLAGLCLIAAARLENKAVSQNIFGGKA